MMNVEALKGIIRPILSDALLRFPIMMQAYIGTQMERSGLKERIAPSTSSKVAINTGNLFRSFARGSEGNIYQVSGSAENLQLTYGSSLPYARVQEYGANIRTKGKMEGYFWYRYRETKIDYFRGIALKIRRTGGVDIKARPYFAPAVQRMKQDNKYEQQIRQQIVQGIRTWQESQRR